MPQLALVVLQTLFGSLSKMRSLKLSTIRTDSKGLHASIDADSGGCLDLTARLLADGCINQNGSMVLSVRIHRDCHILDLAVEALMKHCRDVLALGNTESPTLPVDGAALWIVERLPVLLAFRQWMVSSMFPPVLEGICHLLDGILQGLRVDFAEPGINLLENLLKLISRSRIEFLYLINMNIARFFR